MLTFRKPFGTIPMSNQARAYLYAVTAVAMWSTVATAFKLTLREIDPLQMLFYACGTSALALLIVLGISGKLSRLGPAFREHWRITALTALLNPVLYYVLLFAAYDQLPAQVAQPINYTWAIVLTFLSIVILKQAITRHDLIAAAVCYAGVFIIATQGDSDRFMAASWFGIGLAIASTVIWASYWIINFRDPREPSVGLCLNFLIATPVVALICWLFSDLHISGRGLVGAVYIGLIEMSMAFLAWSHALKRSVNTSRVNNLIFLSPFISLVLIHQVLGEAIYPTTYLGLGLIVGGLVYQQYRARIA